MKTHPKIAQLLQHPDPACWAQAVELTHLVEGEAAGHELASLVLPYIEDRKERVQRMCIRSVVFDHFRRLSAEGKGTYADANRFIRWYATDLVIRTLPSLHIFRTRPAMPYRGDLPDLSAVRGVLQQARVLVPYRERGQYRTHRERMTPGVESCRRWWKRAVFLQDPSLEALQRAFRAAFTVKQACASTPLEALRHALEWGRVSVPPDTSSDAEAGWQQLHLFELLRGRHRHKHLPTDPLFCRLDTTAKEAA